MSSIRILVVEDHQPFQRFICSTLEKWPELQIIGCVSDGLEGVQQAEELQPDLILLDVGLPGLNGIDVARRVRKLSPDSRILFLSQESSADVVQEALSVGALGYVFKARAAGELLTAVEAVRRGMQFVSRVFSADIRDDSAGNQVSKSFCQKLPSPVPVMQKSEITHGHAVRLYSDAALLLDGFSRSITAALGEDDAVIVVARESHRDSLLHGLQAGGVNVSAAIEQKRYISLDVADTLTTFMPDGLSEPVRLAKVVRHLVVNETKGAKKGHPRLAVY